jgi:hypothetical protein
MTLRTLLALLLLANVAMYGWTAGWLEPFWPAPGLAEREPARLAGQVNPESVKVLGSSAAGAARPSAPRCLEVGPFGLVDATAAEAALEAAGLPAGSWERDLRGPSQVWLRVPRADAALREKLQTLAANSAPLSGGFKTCAAP